MESRKRRASSDLQFDPTLADLPEELLIEIFGYLPKQDLLSLTLMCKRLNSIIQEKFIDKLSVYFSNSKYHYWIGSRPYTNLHFEPCEEKKYFYFSTLIEDPDKVKIVSFRDRITTKQNNRTETKICYVDPVIFRSILRVFKNIKMLHLPNLSSQMSAIPIKTVQKLYCSQYYKNIDLLYASSLQEIHIKRGESSSWTEELEEFLLSQKSLKSMTLDMKLIDSSGCIPLFTTNRLQTVNFQLKNLTMHKPDEFVNNENFYYFINNHVESLKTLKIYQLSSITILNHFRGVKSLENVTIEMQTQRSDENDILEVRDSIKFLDISGCSVKFDEKFPNLKVLKVSKINSNIQVGNLKQLEFLSFKNCVSKVLNVPSTVNHLEFIDHTFDSPPEFAKPIKINQMVLRNCKKVFWLHDFIRDQEFLFNILELTGIELPCTSLDTIAEQKCKIKKIRSKNVNFIE